MSIRKKGSYDIRLTISLPSNNRIIMSCTIDKEAFQRLINRDLEWLMEQPRSPERDHIEAIIKQTIDLHYERLKYLGLIPDGSDVRSHNEGNSNYNDGTHIITPWTIWLDYPELTSWDDDIIKRVLRTKADAGYTPEEQRILDYKKIIHNCQERIRQLKYHIK